MNNKMNFRTCIKELLKYVKPYRFKLTNCPAYGRCG